MPEMYTKLEEEQDHPWTSCRRGHLLGGYKVFPIMSAAPGQGLSKSSSVSQHQLSTSHLNLTSSSPLTTGCRNRCWP